MWTSRLDDDVHEKTWVAKAAAMAALTLSLALAGCSADYVENSQAPVLLVITAINDGAQLDSDIRNGTNAPDQGEFVCENEVPVDFVLQSKNPGSPASTSSTVLLTGYEVQYSRTDGRATEGVDVPYRITGNLAASIEVGGELSVPIEVVRRQAKLEPPLSNVQQAEILTVMAEVTVYGTTVSGKKVSASGRFQIDFANYGDKDTTCPTN